MARRITRAFITGRPSSEMATAPAAFMAPMAASSSPALPLVMAPMGNTLTTALAPRALHDVAGHRGAVVHRLGVGHAADGGESAGRGRARAAFDGLGVLEARLAQVHVHVDEAGRDDQPAGVEDLGVAATDRSGATPAMRPSSISTSAMRSVSEAGSMTRPFLISDAPCYPITLSSTAMRTATPFSTWFRITERWKSATSRRQLAAAVDGARDASRWRPAWPGPGAPGAGRRTGNIRWPGKAASCCRSSCTRSIMITSASRMASRISVVRRTPGASCASSAGSSEAGPQSTMSAPNFESRCTLERATRLCAISPMMATRRPSSVAAAVQNGARVEQRLGGMLVRAVAGVDDRRGQVARQEMRRAGGRMAHHDGVRPHGRQRVQRIHQRFALGHAGTGAVMETASAPRRLAAISKLVRVRVEASKKRLTIILPAQRVELLQRLALQRLKILGARQNGFDLGAVQLFDSQQSGSAWFSYASPRGGSFHQQHFFHAVDLLELHFDDFDVAWSAPCARRTALRWAARGGRGRSAPAVARAPGGRDRTAHRAPRGWCGRCRARRPSG